MTAHGPEAEDRHPAPPPDIPVWALFLVVIILWVASVLATGGLADWIMEGVVFGARFGDWSYGVGITFMIAVAQAARESRDT